MQSRKVYSQYLIEEILYTNRTNLSQEQQKRCSLIIIIE